MIDNLPKNCCGCAACEASCPYHAIQIVTDSLGFFLPTVNLLSCRDCGICEKVCPFLRIESCNHLEFPISYAARHKNIKEIETSRSGAVFIALSSRIIEDGGIVYGAAFSNNCTVKHQKAQSKIELIKFKGSKYTQSDMRGIIKDIRKELSASHPVLFSGTPCQTAAVRNSINISLRNKLYLIDIICHGTASPKFWSDYINDLEAREHKKIIKADFRDKNLYGWDGLHRESFIFENNKKYTYPITFYQPFLIREACSKCPYASIKRYSDLTLGDFWNWESICPEMNNDKKGISLVLINSVKGLNLFNQTKNSLDFKEIQIEQCLQLNLQQATPRDIRADEFAKDYVAKGYLFVKNKYYSIPLIEKIKYRVKRALETD